MPLVKDTRSYALIIALLASFLTPFVGSSINIALPVIGRDLGINALFLGWIPTIYLLALAILLIPMGRISDIYGRKRIFQWGIIIFTISSFLASFSISGEMLLFFRIVQGVGSAMIFGNVSAIVAAVFPVMQRGRALGWAATGAYLGLFLGPPLGGFLTQNLGWQSIFYFNVPLGIFCAYSARHIKEEWR
ncbi:MAG: MFS transporter, partial [Methanobacterium sp.]|nr:MFS transporter [Methanobacterium sp.]